MQHRALIGSTGFVGTALRRQARFDALYNSTNLADITNRTFAEIVCAAAPATMWHANQNPEGDRANLLSIVEKLKCVSARRLILISSIAVLDDASGGYTEATARYETAKAYGRNRREFELLLRDMFEETVILRLPALFGAGLKKNFIFDLMNPVASFFREQPFDQLRTGASPAVRRALEGCYRFDSALGMWALDRQALDSSGARPAITALVEQAGLAARGFTNADSHFQYYDIGWLEGDIRRAVTSGIEALHVCCEPLSARDIARDVAGIAFDNPNPPLAMEDMRSGYADLWGRHDGYLYGRDAVLGGLKALWQAEALR